MVERILNSAQNENKMGTEKMSRLIIATGIPLTLSLLINSLYNFLDSVMRLIPIVAYFVSIPNLVYAAALQGLSLGTKSMYLTVTRQAVFPVIFALFLRLFGVLDFIWSAFILSPLYPPPYIV